MNKKRIAVYYEHPEWFKPLFSKPDLRDVSYEKTMRKGFFPYPIQILGESNI